MYLEYIVRLPGRATVRACGEARGFLAKLQGLAAGPDQFDPRLLHLTNTGRPRHAPTAIRIRAHRQSLIVSAVGYEAVECLQTNAPKVQAMLTRHLGADPEHRFVQGECDLQIAPTVCSYRIASLVLLRRGFTQEFEGGSFQKILDENLYEQPKLIARVGQVITEGLERQAGICLLDLPLLLLGDIQVHRLAPVLVKPKVYFLVGTVSFRAGLVFRGPWHVGYLQSRGYGRIVASTSAASGSR